MQEKSLPIITVSGDWVLYPLPHQEALIEKFGANQVRQEAWLKLIKERSQMNFEQAIKEIKSGKEVRRPSWDKDMFMWWSGSYCLHTHPYFDFQTKAPELAGYFYVLEKDDAYSKDWELATA